MKNLHLTVTNKVETVSKVETITMIKKDVKNEMNKNFRRLDKLVKAYFRLEQHSKTYNRLKALDSKRINTNVFNRVFSFESTDAAKFSSFLTQIFELPYFAANTKGLTVSQFVNLLFELCTTKDNKVKTHKARLYTKHNAQLFNDTFDHSDDIINGIYTPSNYDDIIEISVQFNEALVCEIFELYI